MHPKRRGMVFALATGYLLLLLILEPIIGQSAFLLVVVPVAAAAWEFGLGRGLIAGGLGVLLNSGYLIVFNQFSLADLLEFGIVSRTVMLITVVILMWVLHGRVEERFREADESQIRRQYFPLLTEITSKVLLAGNLDLTLRYLAGDVARLSGADDCTITRWDEEKQAAFTMGAGEDFLGITASVMKAGHALIVDDVNNSPHINAEIARKYPVRAIMGVPLMARDQKLGAVILAFHSPHRFEPGEIERAEHAANQIAVALLIARQDMELTNRLRESDAFAKIAIALSQTEKVGLSDVLQLIVNFARELIPAIEQAVIHLLDEEKQMLIPKALIGYEFSEEGKRKMRVGEGVAGQALASGRLINIPDVITDPRFIMLNPNSTVRSLIVLPIASGANSLGTLSVQSSIPNVFTEHDNKLLIELGIQASIAIENAHLMEGTQQALKETSALHSVIQGAAAAFDPDKVIKDTVDLLQKNFDYRYVQVFVADPETGNFVMRAGSGTIGAELKRQGHYLPPGQGIVGYVAETGEAYFTNNVDESVSFVPNPFLMETKSEMAVPVKIRNEVLGILDVQQSPPKRLSQRDLQLVSAVADQFAIALQKATLYEELQISLQQEKAIRNQLVQNERLTIMGRLLASVSHELNNPLQAIQNALFLLKEEKGISQQGRQDLNIVLAESERMAGMIERLRDTYRPIQAHEFRPTQINNLIEDVHALIATHLRHNEIIFEYHPEETLPVIPTLSDQIRQVLLNLMMNAVEAMPSGGTLKVCTKCQADCQEIMISVSDTGAGIQEDILPHLFEAFVTDKPQGTGLGLTITYDIVTKHRGRITAENNPDKGATFRVWLPLESREVI